MHKLLATIALFSLLVAPGCIGWCKGKFSCCKPKQEKIEKKKKKTKVASCYKEKE